MPFMNRSDRAKKKKNKKQLAQLSSTNEGNNDSNDGGLGGRGPSIDRKRRQKCGEALFQAIVEVMQHQYATSPILAHMLLTRPHAPLLKMALDLLRNPEKIKRYMNNSPDPPSYQEIEIALEDARWTGSVVARNLKRLADAEDTKDVHLSAFVTKFNNMGHFNMRHFFRMSKQQWAKLSVPLRREVRTLTKWMREWFDVEIDVAELGIHVGKEAMADDDLIQPMDIDQNDSSSSSNSDSIDDLCPIAAANDSGLPLPSDGQLAPHEPTLVIDDDSGAMIANGNEEGSEPGEDDTDTDEVPFGATNYEVGRWKIKVTRKRGKQHLAIIHSETNETLGEKIARLTARGETGDMSQLLAHCGIHMDKCSHHLYGDTVQQEWNAVKEKLCKAHDAYLKSEQQKWLADPIDALRQRMSENGKRKLHEKVEEYLRKATVHHAYFEERYAKKWKKGSRVQAKDASWFPVKVGPERGIHIALLLKRTGPGKNDRELLGIVEVIDDCVHQCLHNEKIPDDYAELHEQFKSVPLRTFGGWKQIAKELQATTSFTTSDTLTISMGHVMKFRFFTLRDLKKIVHPWVKAMRIVRRASIQANWNWDPPEARSIQELLGRAHPILLFSDKSKEQQKATRPTDRVPQQEDRRNISSHKIQREPLYMYKTSIVFGDSDNSKMPGSTVFPLHGLQIVPVNGRTIKADFHDNLHSSAGAGPGRNCMVNYINKPLLNVAIPQQHVATENVLSAFYKLDNESVQPSTQRSEYINPDSMSEEEALALTLDDLTVTEGADNTLTVKRKTGKKWSREELTTACHHHLPWFPNTVSTNRLKNVRDAATALAILIQLREKRAVKKPEFASQKVWVESLMKGTKGGGDGQEPLSDGDSGGSNWALTNLFERNLDVSSGRKKARRKGKAKAKPSDSGSDEQMEDRPGSVASGDDDDGDVLVASSNKKPKGQKRARKENTSPRPEPAKRRGPRKPKSPCPPPSSSSSSSSSLSYVSSCAESDNDNNSDHFDMPSFDDDDDEEQSSPSDSDMNEEEFHEKLRTVAGVHQMAHERDRGEDVCSKTGAG
ncbi:hypothetical protein HDV00_005806 [Rhizophlyctis rosea]|nr:hypothetical protein HDV00_005806 [Rhizophlyctis rosea]